MFEFKTAEQVIEILINDNGTYIYRGYHDDSQMISRLGRWGYEKYEHDLLYDFINLNLFKEKIQLNNISQVIELAQHFEIPTRFLDWSYDIKVALYFANEFHKESDDITYLARAKTNDYFRIMDTFASLGDYTSFELYDLDKYTLGELDVISLFHSESDKHIQNGRFVTYDLFLKKLSNCVLNENVTLANNPRIRAQKGCFIVSKNPKEKFVPQEVFKLNLNSIEKKKLLNWINEERIRFGEPEFYPILDAVYSDLSKECVNIVSKYRKLVEKV